MHDVPSHTPGDASSRGTSDHAPPRPQLAAAYGRKSNPSDEGVDSQLIRCVMRAEQDGWTIPDSPAFRYADDAVSGAKTKQPGSDALLAVVRSGRAPFTRLYIRELDRLTRAADPRHWAWFEYECARHGVMVVYAKDAEHVDVGTETDSGRVIVTQMTRTFDAMRARAEWAKIRERTREAIREMVIQGWVTGPYQPYATERVLVTREGRVPVQVLTRGLTVRAPGHRVLLRWDPALVPVVRTIFAALDRGESLGAVARDLEVRGVPRPGGARCWKVRSVRRIARDPIYTGDYVYGGIKDEDRTRREADLRLVNTDHAIVVRDFMPDAPIPRDLIARIQARLRVNKDVRQRRMATKPLYPATGLLGCTACGARLHGHTAPARGDGAPRRYYLHPGPRARGEARCRHAHRYVRAEPLDAALGSAVHDVLQDDVLVGAAEAHLDRLLGNLRTPDHTREIAAVEAELDRTAAAAAQAARNAALAPTKGAHALHMGTANALADEETRLRGRLGDIRAREAQLQAAADALPTTARGAAALRAALEQASTADRVRVWHAVIAGIEVDLDVGRATLHVRVPLKAPGPECAAPDLQEATA